MICPLPPTNPAIDCSFSYGTFCYMNTKIDHGRCIANASLLSDPENIFPWCFYNHVIFNLQNVFFNFFEMSFYLATSVFWFVYFGFHRLFLCLACPLVLRHAGLPSYLSLPLALREKLIFCSVPSISSPQFIFYCTNLKSASHLNAAVTCRGGFVYIASHSWSDSKKGHPSDRRSFTNIYFAAISP